MKKTYLLEIEGKNRDRLLDAAKHDIRKYIKRERSKDLPKGVDFWDFDCRAGADAASAHAVHQAELITAIDVIVQDGAKQFYVEVSVKPAQRTARPREEGFGQNNDPDAGDDE